MSEWVKNVNTMSFDTNVIKPHRDKEVGSSTCLQLTHSSSPPNRMSLLPLDYTGTQNYDENRTVGHRGNWTFDDLCVGRPLENYEYGLI